MNWSRFRLALGLGLGVMLGMAIGKLEGALGVGAWIGAALIVGLGLLWENAQRKKSLTNEGGEPPRDG